MPGTAQRKYVGETMRIHKKLKHFVRKIADILPYEYDKNDVFNLFKGFYPLEWKEIIERCKHYKEKDDFLVKVGKKPRYKPSSAEGFFFGIPAVRYILSAGFIKKHKERFDEDTRKQKYDALRKSCEARNVKIQQKIAKNTELMQNVEPYYVDALITAYHQRGITTEGKIEIVKEMGKFLCDKSIKFFYKLNDAERNNQIRRIAFNHLQNSGHYVKLRKNFKGKKKNYMIEKSDFNMTPLDLIKRLDSDSIQNQKRYSVFVSHSYRDSLIVKNVIAILNKQKRSCYCDWTSDNDFLKRSLVSDYTKEVLKRRIEQSDCLFFIRTNNSMTGEKVNSEWIEMELEYSKEIGKQIYYIDLLNDGVKLPYNLLNHNLTENIIDWSN
jgi:hypothetical protein